MRSHRIHIGRVAILSQAWIAREIPGSCVIWLRFFSLQELLIPRPSVQRGFGIYRQHLAETGRGIPMWLPGPSSTLPDAYRRRGISVGDVGILMASGGFDFFFNIYLPADHAINQQGVPAGFSPLPTLQPSDIYRNPEFGPNSFFVSTSVEGKNDSSYVCLLSRWPILTRLGCRGITFKSSASEGAILVMPQGGYSEELLNVSALRQYLLANAESWYVHVNDTRGREARNGDLVLVRGCDKASSWLMATFTKSMAYDFRLRFKPIGETGSRRTYGWDYSGKVDLRIGPHPEETELMRDDSGQSVVYTNQTLFVRVVPVKLRDAIWQELGFDFETTTDV